MLKCYTNISKRRDVSFCGGEGGSCMRSCAKVLYKYLGDLITYKSLVREGFFRRGLVLGGRQRRDISFCGGEGGFVLEN